MFFYNKKASLRLSPLINKIKAPDNESRLKILLNTSQPDYLGKVYTYCLICDGYRYFPDVVPFQVISVSLFLAFCHWFDDAENKESVPIFL